MRNRRLLVLMTGLVFLLCAGLAFSADFKVKQRSGEQLQSEYANNEILVKFKPTAKNIPSIHATLGATEIPVSMNADFQRLRIPPTSTVEEMLAAYRANPDVEYAEPNYIYHAFLVPNDPYYSYQWHMPSINVEPAWDLSTGAGVLVGVIDTGVGYENYGVYGLAPDLAGATFVAGYDFVNNDAHANDDNAHGTHVTGTIRQSTNNGLGVAGVAFNCSIMPIKVLDAGGSGYVSDIAEGITYAADHGCKVINMSLGGPTGSTTLQSACTYAYNAGVTIICAAGNAGTSTPQYPAAYTECISVSSVRYDNTRPSYSCYGSTIDICAPGGDLTVDQNGDGYNDGVLQQTFEAPNYTTWSYWFYDGTSMASPHVAGVAAMVIAKAGGTLTPAQVRNYLQSTATDLGTSGWDQYYGYGKVNAYQAVLAVGGGGSAPVAAFTGTPTSGTVPLTVQFTDQSTNSPTSWAWTFGDGGTSTAQNPSHQYTATGTYTVSLTATNSYGSDVETKTGYITVNAASQYVMHVHDIVVTRVRSGSKYLGRAVITIRDANGNAVPSARVYATYTGPNTGTRNALTTTSGTVTLSSTSIRNPVGEWCFQVTNVTKSGWTYNAAANVVTKSCESGDVFKEGEIELAEGAPQEFALHQNFPNPFNPRTTISFTIPTESHVTLEVFNVTGEKVATLVDGTRTAGLHLVPFDATGLSTGIYVYRLTAGDMRETRKMILLK